MEGNGERGKEICREEHGVDKVLIECEWTDVDGWMCQNEILAHPSGVADLQTAPVLASDTRAKTADRQTRSGVFMCSKCSLCRF